MNTLFNYEADWRPYAFEKDISHIASFNELSTQYNCDVLKKKKQIKHAGIPILSDGENVVFDGNNEMNIIFGETGSKKSRVLIAPFICMCAQAGESMIIPDIKGELSQGVLSPQIQGILQENNYTIHTLNFRDMNCDGFNVLQEPYMLYRNGKREEAMCELNKIIKSFASIYNHSSSDPFWEQTATQYLMAIIVLLFELCDNPQKINILTLANYTHEQSSSIMNAILKHLDFNNNISSMLKNILSEPEKTRMSTLATVNSFFSDFIINEKLLKMLSTTTFNLSDLYEKKTALFLIIPDETDAFSYISGLLLSQISSFLVRKAYEFGGNLPKRVNFICDEFTQYYIPNMSRNISAHRSRNIRWTIVCQSKKQLESAYPKDAATILANCTNTFFLSSPEEELLQLLSARSGYTNISTDGNPKPLINVEQLRHLKKGWDNTDVFFCSNGTVCVSSLPDIKHYQFVSHYVKPGILKKQQLPTASVYTPTQMLNDITRIHNAYVLSQDNKTKINSETNNLAKRYKNLFTGNFSIKL